MSILAHRRKTVHRRPRAREWMARRYQGAGLWRHLPPDHPDPARPWTTLLLTRTARRKMTVATMDSGQEDAVVETGPTPPAELHRATDQNEGASDPPLHDELPISYRRRANQCAWLADDGDTDAVEIHADLPAQVPVIDVAASGDDQAESTERPALKETTPTPSTTPFYKPPSGPTGATAKSIISMQDLSKYDGSHRLPAPTWIRTWKTCADYTTDCGYRTSLFI